MSAARGVAVVTGASAGVGRATARELARRGFDVALLARGEAGLISAEGEVHAAGRKCVRIPTDVSSGDQVDAAARQVEESLGPIDVWINNAMTTVFGRFWECDPADYARATEVTDLGQVHGTMAALARMRPRNRGRIVNVGSALAYVGIPLQSAYCGAKFACRGFTQSVRAELLAEGSAVSIGMVHLPAVNTPQFGWCKSHLPRQPQPVPPIYEPEVAAHAIVNAAIDGRRAKVLGVWNKVVVTAARLVPATTERFSARTAVDSQQTDEAVSPDRPSDLWEPVDQDVDHGAHGAFGSRSSGMRDAEFVRSLPSTVSTLVGSSFATAAAHAATGVRMVTRDRVDGARR
jgi:short-subunit dehydrogenase